MIIGAARGRFLLHASLAVVGYAGQAFLLRGVLPLGIQKFSVAPNELAEMPQLANHIAATRRAWGLDSVVTRDLNGERAHREGHPRQRGHHRQHAAVGPRSAAADLRAAAGDPHLLRLFSVDDDRYRIDGQYRQVLLSPRELNPASLPTRTFINERLTFTHGMGLTLAP